MPATGPCAPARTFVAVRAMVPVTQMPENRPDAIFGQTLRHQLAIRPVPTAGHAVGDDGRQQGFDRAEQREGEGAGQHRENTLQADLGQRWQGQRRGDAAELRADGRHRQVEGPRDQGGGGDGDKHFRQAGAPPLQPDDEDNGGQRQGDGRRIESRQCLPEHRQLLEQRPGFRPGKRQAQHVADLAGEDDHRDAGGKAHRDRIGDELDVGAEPQETGRGQHEARQDGGQDQPVHAVGHDGRRHQHDEGTGWPADLEAAAAQRRYDEAPDDGRIEPLRWRGAGGNGDRHGKRQGDDGYRQAGNGVGTQVREAVAFRAGP